MKKYQLRLLDSVRDHTILGLPVAYEGNLRACREYARDNGYEWRPDKLLLFKGYYVNQGTGDCLFPT